MAGYCFTGNTIHWRAASDKVKKDWQVPMAQALREELKAFRVKLGGAFGGLVFPSEQDSSVPLRRDVFGKWLLAAEKRAGLAKLDGSLWHAFRRAWASARKDLSPHRKSMERTGIEPATSWLQTRRSPS